ncbi:aspartate ammonia-lyase [Engelhardtia mirabilis]|uniref:Aspartate ammonia-lyase n=1 Tax=Engelhardtia mirabilis TaxID=2528011 RepID=A0A518BN32_9BACT|nr:Aspartate ammonia-lyase [Planctomycetes bacterium Pla133]QDV02717.1 Aspartate ammonia-lyase [Planctomycetes bacterium Pla86]
MNRPIDAAFVGGIELFEELPEPLRADLAAVAERRSYVRGEVVFEEGDARVEFLRIVSGRVDVTARRFDGAEDHLVSYGPAETLGEGVLLEGSMHSSTGRAGVDTVVVAFPRAELVRILRENSEGRAIVLGAAVKILTRRLDQTATVDQAEVRQFTTGKHRAESDSLGPMEVPFDAYWGAQTQRALDNFQISSQRLFDFPTLVRALAAVKQAAARANRDCGALDPVVAEAIDGACEELRSGKLLRQFPLDVVQGGAGTSTNMNVNEVIANRALISMGYSKGEYEHCDPNDHVNCSQSTNDVYPTAIKLAVADSNQGLVEALELLVASLRHKAVEFARVTKIGRTQLQDAVPMTLGQEFGAWAHSVEREVGALRAVREHLCVINLGGTAIGTGLNAPKGYAARAVGHLRELTELPLSLAEDLIEATQDTQGLVLYSGGLKSLAIKLSKICNDLRLLSSGPRAGLAEIELPAVQPGSSIMPGKVNPVIPEVVNQVCFRVIGADMTVTMAAEAGQLQLNVMEPVMALAVLESQSMLEKAVRTLALRCVDGIVADVARCRDYVERSIGVVTALVPRLGYDLCAELAKEAKRSGRGIVELVRERQLLDGAELEALLAPDGMTGPSANGR